MFGILKATTNAWKAELVPKKLASRISLINPSTLLVAVANPIIAVDFSNDLVDMVFSMCYSIPLKWRQIMPIKKAALKRMRSDKKRRERNLQIVNELKTKIKHFRELLSNNKKDEARRLIPGIASRLNKATQKKIIHRNKAARTISRLEKAIRRLSAA